MLPIITLTDLFTAGMAGATTYRPVVLQYDNKFTDTIWELRVQQIPAPEIIFEGEQLPTREEMEDCLRDISQPVEGWMVDMFLTLAEIAIQNREEA